MSQVVLKYPVTGTATLTMDLGYPATSVPVKAEPNQKEYRATAGNLWTAKVGPTIYTIRRKWEALRESEVAALFAFLEGVGFAANRIRYTHLDVASGLTMIERCRLVSAPDENAIHINNRDVTLEFEQYVTIDEDEQEGGAVPDGALLIDDADNMLGIDDSGNVLGIE
jgi:hypothetical protein